MVRYPGLFSGGKVPAVLADELDEIVDRAEHALQAWVGVWSRQQLLPDIEVRIDCSHALSDRNFAAVEVGDPAKLYLCEDLALQPVTRIRGILWHEVGHILDWLDLHGGLPLAASSYTRGMDEEQRADRLVDLVCKMRIYYDSDLVQRAGPGARGTSPRPSGLR